jgi:hypothetical protein
MRNARDLLILSAVAVLLTGCATTAADSGGAASDSPSASPSSTVVDAAAAAKADAWLRGAVLPPGAVRTDSIPDSTPPINQTNYVSPCSPTEQRSGYWTVKNMDVIDAATWMAAHPTGGLIATAPPPQRGDTPIDGASVGNAKTLDALEGIAWQIARTSDGVAIRAQIVVFTKSTTCPSLPPGESYGGIGQG